MEEKSKWYIIYYIIIALIIIIIDGFVVLYLSFDYPPLEERISMFSIHVLIIIGITMLLIIVKYLTTKNLPKNE